MRSSPICRYSPISIRSTWSRPPKACGEILSADGGLDRVLALVRSALPKKLRETAYAMALEVAAADMEVNPEEIRFLEMLSESLELDRLTTAAIERGIRARNTVL